MRSLKSRKRVSMSIVLKKVLVCRSHKADDPLVKDNLKSFSERGCISTRVHKKNE